MLLCVKIVLSLLECPSNMAGIYKRIYDEKPVYDKFWYFIKLVLAAIISAFALSENSKEGVIGTMLISPLGIPVISTIVTLMKLDFIGFTMNVSILIFSIAILIVIGLCIGYLYRKSSPSAEMTQRHNTVTTKTIFIAYFIGLVMAMGSLMIGETNGFGTTELIGAGIAISLLPPLVNAGLTYSNEMFTPEDKYKYTFNSIKLSFYNIVGVALGTLSVLIFSN